MPPASSERTNGKIHGAVLELYDLKVGGFRGRSTCYPLFEKTVSFQDTFSFWFQLSAQCIIPQTLGGHERPGSELDIFQLWYHFERFHVCTRVDFKTYLSCIAFFLHYLVIFECVGFEHLCILFLLKKQSLNSILCVKSCTTSKFVIFARGVHVIHFFLKTCYFRDT